MNEWGLVIAIAIFGSAFISLTGSGHERNYGRTFIYALVGLITLTASMVSTILVIGRFGKNTDNETAYIGIACLVGLFVTTPIAFSLVFFLLDKVI